MREHLQNSRRSLVKVSTLESFLPQKLKRRTVRIPLLWSNLLLLSLNLLLLTKKELSSLDQYLGSLSRLFSSFQVSKAAHSISISLTSSFELVRWTFCRFFTVQYSISIMTILNLLFCCSIPQISHDNCPQCSIFPNWHNSALFSNHSALFSLIGKIEHCGWKIEHCGFTCSAVWHLE